MKPIFALISLAILSAPAATAQDDIQKSFEDGMRQAFADFKKGDDEAVTARLRALLQLMEEKAAAKVGGLLSDTVEGWKGETPKRENLAAVGGGVSISRTYVSGEHRITVKIVKDSPLVGQLLPLLANEELIRLTNRKTHQVAGETAIMDGEHKLQMVVDERIYVELESDEGTSQSDLVAFARKLDLAALAKMK